jgi:deoxyribonuclease V
VNPDWLHPPTLKAATVVQREIALAVERTDRIGAVALIAGCDTSNKWRDSRGPIHAAIAPIDWPSRVARPAATATRIPPFPYVSGYLGFRESPSLIAAWETLAVKPDLLFVDGQGQAHPRRCGIASHLGVLLDVPTIAVAKSLLCGTITDEVGPEVGDAAPVVDRDEVVAMALRLRPRAAPVFVGIGHRVSLETAVAWAMQVADGRRLPPPIRAAHEAANAARREYSA